MLKNKNLFFLAVICILSGTSYAQRKVAEEAIIFKEVRDGVFTVFGDEGQGSGFLIDSKGLILTNQHVIANSSHIRVQINDSIKVSGKLLAADDRNDVAVVMVHPSVVEGLPILKLSDITNNPPFEGEKVIAIGSPLHQHKILTSGLISKVLETAVVSDVNLNPGNSGGPLINMDGEVIAINTFVDPGRGTPGVSGSILITQASDIIEKAEFLADSITPPTATLLPTMPKNFYPLPALEYAATVKKRDTKPYNVTELIVEKALSQKNPGEFYMPEPGVRNYDIYIITPPCLYWLENRYKFELAKKRKAREKKGKIGEEERYNPFDNLKEWYQYLGKFSPTVMIVIMPQIYEDAYEADLKDFSISLNGLMIPEIYRAMLFQPLFFYSVDFFGAHYGGDLARTGTFIYPYELFQPINDEWPKINLNIVSIEKPNDTAVVVVPRYTVEQVWSDFEPYREQIKADSTTLLIDNTELKNDVLSEIHLGMAISEVEGLLGKPDTAYNLEYGKNTEHKWEGKVYKYYGPRDPFYKQVKRKLTNTFVFYTRGNPPKLNHWNIEYTTAKSKK